MEPPSWRADKTLVVYQDGTAEELNNMTAGILNSILQSSKRKINYNGAILNIENKSFRLPNGRVGYFIDLTNPPEGISSITKELLRDNGRLRVYDSKGNKLTKWPLSQSTSVVVSNTSYVSISPKDFFSRNPSRLPIIDRDPPTSPEIHSIKDRYLVLYKEPRGMKAFVPSDYQEFILAKMMESVKQNNLSPYRFIREFIGKNKYNIDLDLVPEYLTFRLANGNIGYFVPVAYINSAGYKYTGNSTFLTDTYNNIITDWNQLTEKQYEQQVFMDTLPRSSKRAIFPPLNSHYPEVDPSTLIPSTYGNLPLVVITTNNDNITRISPLTQSQYTILNFILSHLPQGGYYSILIPNEDRTGDILVDVDVSNMAYRNGEIHYFVIPARNPNILQGAGEQLPNGDFRLYSTSGQPLSKWPPFLPFPNNFPI